MLDPGSLIAALNEWPPELLLLAEILLCFGTILVMLRLFGAGGLYVYIAIAVIGANLQVLKVVKFGIYADPVALGTVLFASTYLVTDILAEYYGRAEATRAVWLGFASLLFFNIILVLTLGYAPLTAAEAGEDWSWALPIHDHLAAIGTPSPALFAAGMIAYLLSQHHDVWMFELMSKLTRRRHLWLRNNGSTFLSALIDNTVFSVLAWVVFAANPVGLGPLVFTYILGTYWLRILVALLDTPFCYLARYCLPSRPALAAA